jgi:hypothetical protein
MRPVYVFLATLLLAAPVYAVLYAASLSIPLYLILLGIGIAGMLLFLQRSKGFWLEEVFSLMSLLVGSTCFFTGFAIAPWFVQVGVALTMCVFYQVYWADASMSRGS